MAVKFDIPGGLGCRLGDRGHLLGMPWHFQTCCRSHDGGEKLLGRDRGEREARQEINREEVTQDMKALRV